MSEDAKPDTTTDEDLGPNDGLLQMLVKLCNDLGYGFGVTLYVKGMIVSGETLPYTKFVQDFTQTLVAGFEGAGDADMAAELRKALAGAEEGWKAEAESGAASPPYNYIHLREVQFFQPGTVGFPTPMSETALWRIRLDAVDGFTLGVFRAQRPFTP